MGGLGLVRSSHPRCCQRIGIYIERETERERIEKERDPSESSSCDAARYIGATYAWPGFVCPSVRPSIVRECTGRVLSLQMTVPIIEY